MQRKQEPRINTTPSFRQLFTPFTLGPIKLRNRIVVPAHGTHFMPLDGLPTERQLNYLLAKARGGVGLIITHVTPVLPFHTGAPPVAFQTDAIVPAYRRVVDALHAEGVKYMVQLNAGSGSDSRLHGGVIMAPSAVPGPRSRILPDRIEIPHQMETQDIKIVVEAMRQAATRAREAGFDGVEVQGEVSFLVAQFMSPRTNTRQDEYGGSLDNRLRFAKEVIAAVRDAIGQDRALGIRLSGNELIEDGLTLNDLLEIAPLLEATGHLDFIHVGAGPGMGAHIPPSYYKPGSFLYLTEAIRQVVKLPLICSQRINDPSLAEDVLSSGTADLISMNRAIMADPEMPRKAQEGRLDEIRRCIACNECVGRSNIGMPIACTVNPEMGREKDMALVTAALPKRVMIVGAGPSGLEAARVAALRGHQVTLYEKGDRLGGQSLLASKAPGREDLDELRRYYTQELLRLEVSVHLDSEVTEETMNQGELDAVVIATGSRPLVPDITTSEGGRIVDARSVLAEEVDVRSGQRVLVLAEEHHIQALSTADYLADKGCKVQVLTEALYPGIQIDGYTFETLYSRVLNKGVAITPLTRVKAVKGRRVMTEQVITKLEDSMEGVDLVVSASRGQAADSLYHAVKGRVGELHLIGDALAPRGLIDAILDGARLGRQL